MPRQQRRAKTANWAVGRKSRKMPGPDGADAMNNVRHEQAVIDSIEAKLTATAASLVNFLVNKHDVRKDAQNNGV
jgi:hypothetical protein